MEINRQAAQQFLNELTKSKIVVTFSNNRIDTVISSVKGPDEQQDEYKKRAVSFTDSFWPFTIHINNQFTSKLDSQDSINSQLIDSQYAQYINDLKNRLITEIEENINLRIGKWDILSYLTHLESELKEIRRNFKMSEENIQNEQGEKTIKSDETFEMNLYTIYENRNVVVETEAEPPGDINLIKYTGTAFTYMEYVLSRYWDIQIIIIERILRFVEPRRKVIETTNDYVKVISILPDQPSMLWTKSDTDLLELIIGLHESGAIQNLTKDLTQKEAIQTFSDFFGKEIKDQYKKLNAARNRKKEDPGFITKIQKALDSYYQGLNERM